MKADIIFIAFSIYLRDIDLQTKDWSTNLLITTQLINVIWFINEPVDLSTTNDLLKCLLTGILISEQEQH